VPCENRARSEDALSRGQKHAMDIEQINSIGSLLADLSSRTEQLRGYL
jgi:hypothetical protein